MHITCTNRASGVKIQHFVTSTKHRLYMAGDQPKRKPMCFLSNVNAQQPYQLFGARHGMLWYNPVYQAGGREKLSAGDDIV